jgi:hypothetical protein
MLLNEIVLIWFKYTHHDQGIVDSSNEFVCVWDGGMLNKQISCCVRPIGLVGHNLRQ